MGLRTTVGFAVGPITVALLGFITIPFLAWQFSPDEVGRYALTQNLVGGFVIVATLGLDQAYARHFHFATDRGKLLRTCLGLSMCVATPFVLAIMALPTQIANWVYGTSHREWSSLLAWLLLASVFYRFLTLRLRMQDRAWAYSAAQTLPKLVLLLVLVTWVGALGIRHGGFTIILMALAVSTTSGSLVAQLLAKARVPTELGVEGTTSVRTRSLLRYGFPLAASGAIFWGLSGAAILSLRWGSDFAQLALYGVALNFAAPAVVIQLIITTIWAPALFRQSSAEQAAALVNRYSLPMLVGAMIGVPSVSLGGRLVPWILPNDYALLPSLLPLAVLPATFYAISEINGSGLQYRGRTGPIVAISSISLGTTVAMLFALVPVLGVRGALISNAAGYAVFMIVRALWSHSHMAVERPTGPVYAGVLLLSAATADALLQAQPQWLPLVGWLTILVASCVYFRDFLSKSLTRPHTFSDWAAHSK